MKNRREIILLVSGLVIGLLVGMVMASNNDDLSDLFGSAASDTDTKDTAANKDQALSYYLVELSVAQDWLVEKYPDLEDSEELTKAVDEIAKLPASLNFRLDFLNAEAYIEFMLPQMYAALVNADSVEELEVKPDDETTACLGWDNDPYNPDKPAMYLYLTLPTDQEKSIGIPEDWEELKLDKPQSNTLYWQLLACYPNLEEKPE